MISPTDRWTTIARIAFGHAKVGIQLQKPRPIIIVSPSDEVVDEIVQELKRTATLLDPGRKVKFCRFPSKLVMSVKDHEHRRSGG